MAAVGTHVARAATESSSVVAHTGLGALRGESAAGVSIFRGVPFAQPPLGPLRFRAPVPVQPWSGVRDATRFAAEAMQPGGGSVPQSEDCLYLNVWTPAIAGNSPVFVWIHGGGFTGGNSFGPLQDGSTFAQKGIVCVTIAYRLGVFGFLDLGQELGPEYGGSANNALRDIMLALTWVQQNIAAFGGDPRRVTVGGESAGAKLTDILMGVPSAEPLFQQMISESGGAERVWPLPGAQEVAKGFCAQWSADSAQPAKRLKDAPAKAIIASQERFTRSWPAHFPLRAEIDGTLLQQWPLETIRQGSTRGKRLLLGTNRDESALFLGPHPAVEPMQKDLGNLKLQQFDQIEAKYRAIYPEASPETLRIRSVTAEEYWIPSLRVADAHVDAGGTAFVYRFDYADPKGRFAGLAPHAFELRFVWDRFSQGAPTAAEAALAETVHDAWCSFIRGEVPIASGLPVWPPYTTSTRPTMMLGANSHVENAPAAAEFALWSGLLTQ